MALYKSDPNMEERLLSILDKFEKEGRKGLHQNISITWVRYEEANPTPLSGHGASWQNIKPLYPASIVKIIYALATEAWLHKDLIPDSQELKRAIKEMIVDSSNDATSLVVDLLTGTTSGPSLSGESWTSWKEQRKLINKWIESLLWPEIKNINCCQKTWEDGPYGREKDFYGRGNIDRNTLTTLATARFLESIMTESIVSPPACRRIKKLLIRSLDSKIRQENPNNQIDGFLGEGLPKGSLIWSKAGLMSQARHDAAWINFSNNKPMMLVVFTEGRQRANDNDLLPSLARTLSNFHLEID